MVIVSLEEYETPSTAEPRPDKDGVLKSLPIVLWILR